MRLLKNALISVCIFLISSVVFASQSTEGIQVYQKNMHLYPEHKQKLAEAINRYHHADNVWDAIRDEFSLTHYEDNPQVQQQIEWFMNHQDFLLRSAARAAPYLYYVLQQLKIRHLPGELALLPVMESGYNPFAYSPAGASGVWQMMPATASGYGVKQNGWYDGRRDVIASTKAALDYLAYLGSFFNGNWLLASAAYDTGEGNVISAIRRNIRDGYGTEFWTLPVAQETHEYVPRLLALATIIAHPEKYPVPFPFVRNAPYLAQIDIGGQIDLKRAAFIAGLSLQKLKQLNPGFSQAAIGPNGPYKLVLPIENVQTFSENLARLPNSIQASSQTLFVSNKAMSRAAKLKQRIMKQLPLKQLPPVSENMLASLQVPYTMQPGDTLYIVRQGDNLDKIANHFHMSAKTLQVANQFAANRKINLGDRLVVPTHLISQQNPQGTHSISPGDTVYMVRNGDTIEKIAERYHTFTSAIRVANFLTDNHLKEGDQLVIPTHLSA